MSLPPFGPVPSEDKVLTALRARASEDKFADKVGVLDDECLGDEAAEGEGEDVDLAEPQGLDERVGVVGHGLDGVGHLAGGGADAAVVKGDDAMGSVTLGSQLSSVPARWTKKNTGMPPFGPSSPTARKGQDGTP